MQQDRIAGVEADIHQRLLQFGPHTRDLRQDGIALLLDGDGIRAFPPDAFSRPRR